MLSLLLKTTIFALIGLVQCIPSSLDQKFVDYLDWLKKEGVFFDGIEIRQERENMRGVYAKTDFEEGKTLLYVPDHLVMSVEKAKKSYFGKIMTERKLVPGGNRLI